MISIQCYYLVSTFSPKKSYIILVEFESGISKHIGDLFKKKVYPNKRYEKIHNFFDNIIWSEAR